MGPDYEDQLFEEAGEIYADWRVAGHEPSDRSALEKLCVEHPMLATYLQRIAQMDAGTRRLAQAEGAAGGAFGLDEEVVPREVDVPLDRPGKDAERRAGRTMDRARDRGLSFGKYHLTGLDAGWSKIGKGGAGSVYRAWDEDLRRTVALKLLHRQSVDPGASDALRRRAQARFVHEAQLTAQLDHPGIVPLHDFGVTSTGRPYFTMKLVKGKTLAEVIRLQHGRGGTWDLARALRAFVKACEAVAYAHDKGVIHRDLKPANIMVGKFGEVYVMDWGLLKRVERDEGRVGQALTQLVDVAGGGDPSLGEAAANGITSDGEALGTATYMSPEQALGDLSSLDRRTDVYGLGAILYHILAGEAPFLAGGQRPTVLAIVESHRSGKGPDSLDAVAPRAPRRLRRIVRKAMSPKPDDRHASVAELVDELSSFLEGRIASEWRPRAATIGLGVLAACIVGYSAYRSLLAETPRVAAGNRAQAAVDAWVAERGEDGLADILDQLRGVVDAQAEERPGLIEEMAAKLPGSAVEASTKSGGR